MKNNFIYDFERYDYLDYFLNKAYWHNLMSTNNLKDDSSSSLKSFANFLNKQNIDFFLDELSFQSFHSKMFFNKERYYESIILKPNDRKNITDNLNFLKRNDFNLIMNNSKEMHFIKNKKIIKVLFSYLPFLLNFDSRNLNMGDVQKNGYRRTSSYNKIYFYRKIIFNKKYFKNIIFKFFGLEKKKSITKFKKLTYDEFIDICVEDENSINWLLRKPHLDLVTDHKKYIKVKDILDYFKRPGLLENKLSEVKETDTSEKFEEPIHINKKFWLSGNNFYIFPLIFGFKKNVIAYKIVNEYIQQKNDIKVYSKDYFQSLEDMNKKEIEELFENSPLEITNGAITSGRHRVFAMIGRLIQEKEYVPIYTEIIKNKSFFD